MVKRYFKFPNKKLTNKEVSNIFNAAYTAYVSNTPLNRFITINMESMTGRENKKALIKFLDHYRKFAIKEDFTASYLWVAESTNSVGLHIHILLHLPAGRNINLFKKRCIDNWFKQYQPSQRGKGREFDFKTINYGYFINYSDFYMAIERVKREVLINQSHVNLEYNYHQFDDILQILNYLCKGIELNYQGQIKAKRIGMSRNLT